MADDFSIKQTYTLALSLIEGASRSTADFNFDEHIEEFTLDPEGFTARYFSSEYRQVFKDSYAKAQQILDKLGDVQMICFWEEAYSSLLLRINDFPKVLFLRSKFKHVDLNQLSKPIAIVGSRQISDYSYRLVQELSDSFSPGEITLVSGMAIGVDSAAHEAFMKAGVGNLAVLPDSVLKPVPISNKNIYEEILESGGVLLSEYYNPQELRKYHFPRRNRIIAGLALATVVVQAGEHSGALTTARLAGSYGRLVYTFPARVGDLSFAGNNGLLVQEMAKAIRGGVDLRFEILGEHTKVDATTPSKEVKIQKKNLSVSEAKVLELIGSEAGVNLDIICDKIDTDAASVLSLLASLSVKGLIKLDLEGKYSTI